MSVKAIFGSSLFRIDVPIGTTIKATEKGTHKTLHATYMGNHALFEGTPYAGSCFELAKAMTGHHNLNIWDVFSFVIDGKDVKWRSIRNLEAYPIGGSPMGGAGESELSPILWDGVRKILRAKTKNQHWDLTKTEISPGQVLYLTQGNRKFIDIARSDQILFQNTECKVVMLGTVISEGFVESPQHQHEPYNKESSSFFAEIRIDQVNLEIPTPDTGIQTWTRVDNKPQWKPFFHVPVVPVPLVGGGAAQMDQVTNPFDDDLWNSCKSSNPFDDELLASLPPCTGPNPFDEFFPQAPDASELPAPDW